MVQLTSLAKKEPVVTKILKSSPQPVVRTAPVVPQGPQTSQPSKAHAFQPQAPLPAVTKPALAPLDWDSKEALHKKMKGEEALKKLQSRAEEEVRYLPNMDILTKLGQVRTREERKITS